MKFPYGISDFNAVITEGYYYCDRTDRIPMLENAGKYLLFIRPRRFGKSLLLSTLRHYYDAREKDRFEALFEGLRIGNDPTPLRNRYLILQWDFSCVDPTGTAADIRRALFDHVNTCIRTFIQKYDRFGLEKMVTVHEDGLVSLRSLGAAVKKTGNQLYLLIDEYDNFANEVLTGLRDEQNVYKALIHEKGALKTLFKAVKAAAGEGEIDRVFITGVSPVVMSDITSGFNIAKNIYLDRELNDLCGFTEAEVIGIIEGASKEADDKKAEAVRVMRTYYNGYTFAPDSDQRIYNPTLTLYFAEVFGKDGTYPRKMLDANLATDEAKLEYMAQMPRGRQLLLDITREKTPVTVTDIADRFGIREMLRDSSKDHAFLASFLYYFGVLTIAGETAEGDLMLTVPNLVMRGLYVDKIREMLLPEPGERDDGRAAAKMLYAEGDMGPLCEFVENRYFRVFHNPDYRWANELTVKTAFLTLLYNDILYIMDSERETGRGYADLTMIIRPDKRHFEIFDVLIEFKFVKLGDAGVTGEAAKELSSEALRKIPAMAAQMSAAREQVKRYGAALETKYAGKLRLRMYAVVSLGFERVWGEEVVLT